MFHIVAVNLYGDAVATETIELPYENSDAYYTALAANVELLSRRIITLLKKLREFRLPHRESSHRMELP